MEKADLRRKLAVNGDVPKESAVLLSISIGGAFRAQKKKQDQYDRPKRDVLHRQAPNLALAAQDTLNEIPLA